MKRAWLCAIGFLVFPAAATPPPALPVHSSDKAHCALLRLVSDFNRRDASLLDRVNIVGDQGGAAAPDQADPLYAELLGTGGGRLELIDWGLVRQRQARAVYAMILGSDKFEAGRVVATGEPVYVYRHQTSWLVSFSSDHVVDMRRGEALEILTGEAAETPACASGQ